MYYRSKILSIILLSIILQSCNNHFNKEGVSTLVGGATGALIGGQFGKGEGRIIGVGIGALLGGIAGNKIGKALDEKDKILIAKNSQQALEQNSSGQASVWKNPDSGNSGYITPNKTYQNYKGEYCREYTQTIVIGNKKEEGFGTACRKPDGSWKIIN